MSPGRALIPPAGGIEKGQKCGILWFAAFTNQVKSDSINQGVVQKLPGKVNFYKYATRPERI